MTIALASPCNRQRNSAGSRDAGADRDPGEMDPAADEDLLASDEVEKSSRHDRGERSRSQKWDRT